VNLSQRIAIDFLDFFSIFQQDWEEKWHRSPISSSQMRQTTAFS
jgi:hypothetical protein